MSRKVIVVAPHFPEYAVEYASGLSSFCDVTVCIDSDQAASEYADREMPVLKRGSIRLLGFKTPLDLLKLVLIVAGEKPNIVHLQEAVGPRRGFFSAALVVLMKRFSKIVLTVHDPVPHPGRDRKAAGRTALFTNFVRRSADVVVVHGAYCATQYRLAGPPASQKIVTSTHGLILSPAETAIRAPQAFRLYFFGRMEQYKGLEVLCEMAELLHGEGLKFELLIAGRGPELDRLENRLRKLPEVEIFNGFVPPIQVIESMQQSDGVILPYLSATQSGVVSAAFANHRYVVASKTGGLVDVVDHMENGILVEPGSATSLAEAVRRLAEDPALRQRLRDGAKGSSQNKFDWEHIAGELSRELF